MGVLAGLLAEFGIDAADAVAAGRLLPVVCDLRDGVPRVPGVSFGAVVHAAASTRFATDGAGEPAATNVLGTRRLLEWCEAAGVNDVHLVSSAYACGRRAPGDVVPEAFHEVRPEFHNDYEASKWEAELLCRAWSCRGRSGRRVLTVYRPSVVVGEFGTGRATKFDAFYIPARATELLSRMFPLPDDPRRWAVPLRIKGRGGDHQNIVPVDYVASMIVGMLRDPATRGRVYQLTHPSPPTNEQIKRAMEEHFRLAGGRFEDPASMRCDDLNEHERLFADVSRAVEHYFTDTPCFSRRNTAATEKALGIGCPPYDTAALRRLFRYAESVGWTDVRRRQPRRARTAAGPRTEGRSACAAYFEGFLPAHVNCSQVAQMTGLTVNVRFTIDHEPGGGEWVCQFERGRLTRVFRALAATQARADFGYRSSHDGFWKGISGRHHPQELFLKGDARITGDVERALKMAMILNAFAREFPCDERTLRPYMIPASEVVTTDLAARSCA